ncbi:MAG: lysophospholipid acyltransferase family protein [Bacteroidales bacterium]|nr:lysophospholipid acyltransferase family protein [Bacteroidales bacterium]
MRQLHGWSRVTYWCIWSVIWLYSLIPLRVHYAVSDLLYCLVYHVVKYRRSLVRRNLSESFPEKTAEELLKTEREFYHWFCDYIIETFALASMSHKEMRRRVTYHNMEYIRELFDKGYNVALYIGHYCNWEWIISIGLHLPECVWAGQVIHELDYKPLDSVFLKLRSSMGTESVTRDVILRKIVRVTRQEKRQMVVGFISDQSPIYQSAHYWTNFLNHPDTLVLTGTERIAKQCNFACVYLDVSRPRRGYYDINVVPMVEESKNVPDWAITEQYFRLFEQTIRRAPQYWLWTHNRWKRNLEGLKRYHATVNKTHNRIGNAKE